MLNIFKSRKFRQGSLATVITAVAIALIVVLNMVVSLLSERYALNLDLTENKMFEISGQTKTILSTLDKDVEVYVLNTEENFTSINTYFVQANEVLKKYAQQSPRITLQYVDLIRNPVFAQKFPNLNLNTASIVVASGGKSTDLTAYDLYNIEYDENYNQRIVSSKAEQAMTSAILRVINDEVVKVSMLTGHNEVELTGLKPLLELNYYEIIEQNLVMEEIDPEAKIAVITAPMHDFSEDELKKLDKFLNNDGKLGKTLLYFAAAEQPDLPALSAFLAEWGIGVGNGVVFESSYNRVYNLNILMPFVDYTEDVYSETVQNAGLVTLVPNAKPLSQLFSEKGSLTVSAPLMFSQTSGVIPADADESWQPTTDDIAGPIPALIVSTNVKYEGMDRITSNVIACGSMIAVEGSILSTASLGNGEFFMNLFNMVSTREAALSIQSKAIGSSELGIQSEQIQVLGLIFVILLPLAVFIFGIVVWLGRRHK